MKTGVLLINLGTPKSPSVRDVRRFLTEFLNDPFVIDLPYIPRKILVNFGIVPIRSPKSAEVYKKIWTENGFPLLTHGIAVKESLSEKLGDDIPVELGMRYQSPSLKGAVDKLVIRGVERIIAIPMFPQYAYSTTRSVVEKLRKIERKMSSKVNIEIVDQFFDHPGLISAFAGNGMKHNPKSFDHILISFHGMPVRHINKVYSGDHDCIKQNCRKEVNQNNEHCYVATSHENARLIAEKMNLSPDDYTLVYQSRLGKSEWLKPYADEKIIELAKQGMKKLLVFSPSFIADCLETTIEIGEEYQELFEEHGGEKIQLVESLNNNPEWIDVLQSLVMDRMQKG